MLMEVAMRVAESVYIGDPQNQLAHMNVPEDNGDALGNRWPVLEPRVSDDLRHMPELAAHSSASYDGPASDQGEVAGPNSEPTTAGYWIPQETTDGIVSNSRQQNRYESPSIIESDNVLTHDNTERTNNILIHDNVLINGNNTLRISNPSNTNNVLVDDDPLSIDPPFVNSPSIDPLSIDPFSIDPLSIDPLSIDPPFIDAPFLLPYIENVQIEPLNLSIQNTCHSNPPSPASTTSCPANTTSWSNAPITNIPNGTTTLDSKLRLTDLYRRHFARVSEVPWRDYYENDLVEECLGINEHFANTAITLYPQLIYTLARCEAWHYMKFEWGTGTVDKGGPPRVVSISTGKSTAYTRTAHKNIQILILNTARKHHRFQACTETLFDSFYAPPGGSIGPTGPKAPIVASDPTAHIRSAANFRKYLRDACRRMARRLCRAKAESSDHCRSVFMHFIADVAQHAIFLNEVFVQITAIATALKSKHESTQDKLLSRFNRKLSLCVYRGKFVKAKESVLYAIHQEDRLADWTQEQLNKALHLLSVLIRYVPSILNHAVRGSPRLACKVVTIFESCAELSSHVCRRRSSDQTHWAGSNLYIAE